MVIHSVTRMNESNYEENDNDTTTFTSDRKHPFLQSQEDIWSRFKVQLESYLQSNLLSYSVLAAGCKNSGKSYTLFGNCENEENQGLVPRTLQYLFVDKANKLKVSCVQFSAYLVNNETIVDLFDPNSIYSYEGAFAYSKTLGPLILPILSPITTSYDQSISILGLILQSYSIIAFNSTNFYDGSSLLISLRIFSAKSNNMFQLTFGDIASFSCPDMTPVSLDRLSGKSLKDYSIRTMKSSLNHLNQVNSITQSSILTYLLQDTLYKATNTFLIACMSGRISCAHENKETSSFVDKFVSWSASSSARDDNNVINSCGDMTQILSNLHLELVQITKTIDEKLREEKKNEKKDLLKNVAEEEANLKVKGKSSIVQRDPDDIPSGLHAPVKKSLLLKMKRYVLRELYNGYMKLSKNESLPYYKFCNTIFIDNVGKRIQITMLPDDTEESGSSTGKKGSKNDNKIKQKSCHVYEYLATFVEKYGLTLLGKPYDKSPFYDETFTDGSSSTGISSKLLALQKPTATTNSDTIKLSNVYSSMEDPYLEYIGPSDCISDYSRCKFKLNGYTVIKGSEIDFFTPNASSIGHVFQPYSHGSRQDIERRAIEKRREEEVYVSNIVRFLIPNNEIDDIQQLLNSPQLKDVHVIQVTGPDVSPLHCIFKEEYDSIKLIPTTSNANSLYNRIILNGHIVEDEVNLEDQDVLLFGYSRFFRVNIPRRPLADNDDKVGSSNSSQKQSSWEYCLLRSYSTLLKSFIFDSEVERRTNNHLKVSREVTYVTKYRERDELMSMKTFDPSDSDVFHIFESIQLSEKCRLCTLIGCTMFANYLSEKMRRLVHIQFYFKGFIPSNVSYNDNIKSYQSSDSNVTKIQIKPFADFLVDNEGKSFIRMYYQSGVCCTPLLSSGSWLWSSEVFQDRFSLMEETDKFFCGPWCEKDPIWLDKKYAIENDPYKDTLDDELIGVGFLYLDSLQYLLDIDDSIPIVNLKGSISGYIKMKVRVWIDQIEMLPSYLTVDKECHIRDFTNRKLIIVFYFDCLKNITQELCASTYIYFRFFSHTKGYKTSRSAQKVINPNMNESIRIEQRISKDFEEYIKSGCIELEVFGKRQVVAISTDSTCQQVILGEVDYNTIYSTNNVMNNDIDEQSDNIVPSNEKKHLNNQISELQNRLAQLQVACDAKEHELEESKIILGQIKSIISSKSSAVIPILASDVDTPSDITPSKNTPSKKETVKNVPTPNLDGKVNVLEKKTNNSQKIKPQNSKGQYSNDDEKNKKGDRCYLQ